MAKKLEELVLRLDADSRQLRKELGLVSKKGKNTASDLSKSFKSASLGITAMRGAALKAGVAVAGIYAAFAGASGLSGAIKTQLEYVDTIGKTAKTIGVTTDFLQEYRFAADQVSISIEKADMGLQRFGRRAEEAADGGGEAQQAFKELGIELDVSGTKAEKTGKRFAATMVALGKIEDPARVLKLSFKFFDSEGAVIARMAGQFGLLTKRFRELGIVIDAAVIKQAEEAQGKLDAMSYVIKSKLTVALLDLSPLLLETTEGLVSVATHAASAWAGLKDFFNYNPVTSNEITDRIAEINEALAKHEREADRIFNQRNARKVMDYFSVFQGPTGRTLNRLLGQGIDQVSDTGSPESLRAERAGLIEKRDNPSDGGAGSAIDAAAAAYETKIAEQSRVRREKGLAAIQRETDQTERLLAARKSSTQEYERTLVSIKSENTARELSVGLQTEEGALLDDNIMRNAAMRAELSALLTAKESGIVTTEREVEELQRLLAAKKLGKEEYERTRVSILVEAEARRENIDLMSEEGARLEDAIMRREQLKNSLNDVGEHGKGIFASLSDGVTRFGDEIGRTFAQMVVTGRSSFGELLSSFTQDFLSQAISGLINIGLFGAGGAGGGGGLLGGIFGDAAGGPVTRNTPRIVGEQGRELFVPDSPGRIISNVALASMRGQPAASSVFAPSITVNVESQGSGDQELGDAAARAVRIEVESAMDAHMRNQRRLGGILNPHGARG